METGRQAYVIEACVCVREVCCGTGEGAQVAKEHETSLLVLVDAC